MEIGVTLAMLLALLLLLLPSMACAETSGTCGKDLIWVLDDEGTLTISGTGKMENYYSDYASPWNKQDVEAVIIREGITSIGD